MPVFETKNAGGSSAVHYSPNVRTLKCLSHCRLHSLVISHFSKIIYPRYNKNKFFTTTCHGYFHNHHVLEQSTHDQNVVLRNCRDRPRIRMIHDTWKSITSCISNMEITRFFGELPLKHFFSFLPLLTLVLTTPPSPN